MVFACAIYIECERFLNLSTFLFRGRNGPLWRDIGEAIARRDSFSPFETRVKAYSGCTRGGESMARVPIGTLARNVIFSREPAPIAAWGGLHAGWPTLLVCSLSSPAANAHS